MAETRKKTRVNVTNVPASDSNNEEGEVTTMAKKNETIVPEPTSINQKENTKMKLSEIQPITLTLDEFKSKTAQEIASLMHNRISRERGKAELTARIRDGRIRITVPEVLADWSFKNVVVEGMNSKIRGVKTPKVTLTKEQFTDLTNPEKADFIEEYTHKRRIASDIIPQLIIKGMPVSPEDVVRLTCGRILIDGVVVERKGNGRQPAITNGVEFA